MARRHRQTGGFLSIEPRLSRLQDVFRATPGLVAVYLYGSYGTADQTPLSDVDLALLFQPEAVPSPERELELAALLTEAAGEEDVSMTVLNRMDHVSAFQVLAQGRLLYLADAEVAADFLEEVLNRYGDYEIDYHNFLRDYDEALREAYGRD